MPQSRIQYSSILTPKLKAQVQKTWKPLLRFSRVGVKNLLGTLNSENKLDLFVGIFSTSMEEFDVISNNMIHHHVNPGLKSKAYDLLEPGKYQFSSLRLS